MRKTFFALLILLLTGSKVVSAQDITFEASAPETVVAGQQFQVSFTLTADDNKYQSLKFESKDFDILYGPSIFTSTSTSVINGATTTTQSITFTYMLSAKKKGQFTIPSGSIEINGKKYASNTLKITVLSEDKTSQTALSQDTVTEKINPEDVFIKAYLSKDTVYEGECVTISFKLFSLYDISLVNNAKFPDFDGFISRNLGQHGYTKEFEPEMYEGRNYRTIEVAKYALYPIQSGNINIDKGMLDLQVRLKNKTKQSKSIFDDFFDLYVNVDHTVFSQVLNVYVKPLPDENPSSSSVPTGEFKMESSFSTESCYKGDSVIIGTIISGRGDLKYMLDPEISFPEKLIVSTPEIKLDYDTTFCRKTIKYTVIPKDTGTYRIPEIKFTYFDPEDTVYKILQTKERTLQVKERPVFTLPKIGQRNVMLVLDISSSMLAEDLKPNRLTAVKEETKGLINLFQNSNIGLIAFAGKSFTQCPLTTDRNQLSGLLQEIKCDMTIDGTAIGCGLANAIGNLNNYPSQSNIIILITDGANNQGDISPQTAATIAQLYNIPIYSIGIRSRDSVVPYPVKIHSGNISYQNIPINIDEQMLSEISELTGGKYFRATDNKSLNNIYKQIVKLDNNRQIKDQKQATAVISKEKARIILDIILKDEKSSREMVQEAEILE